MLNWLEERNNKTVEDMKSELLNPEKLMFAQEQSVCFKNNPEKRFRCYFVYSKSKGRCYILRFNKEVKVITAFPLGRKTLKRYKKTFKRPQHKVKERT
jgi:hypothetical protein